MLPDPANQPLILWSLRQLPVFSAPIDSTRSRQHRLRALQPKRSTAERKARAVLAESASRPHETET